MLKCWQIVKATNTQILIKKTFPKLLKPIEKIELKKGSFVTDAVVGLTSSACWVFFIRGYIKNNFPKLLLWLMQSCWVRETRICTCATAIPS